MWRLRQNAQYPIESVHQAISAAMRESDFAVGIRALANLVGRATHRHEEPTRFSPETGEPVEWRWFESGHYRYDGKVDQDSPLAAWLAKQMTEGETAFWDDVVIYYAPQHFVGHERDQFLIPALFYVKLPRTLFLGV